MQGLKSFGRRGAGPIGAAIAGGVIGNRAITGMSNWLENRHAAEMAQPNDMFQEFWRPQESMVNTPERQERADAASGPMENPGFSITADRDGNISDSGQSPWMASYAQSWRNLTNRVNPDTSPLPQAAPMRDRWSTSTEFNPWHPLESLGNAGVSRSMSPGASAILNHTNLPLQPEGQLVERDALRSAEIGYANNPSNDVRQRQRAAEGAYRQTVGLPSWQQEQENITNEVDSGMAAQAAAARNRNPWQPQMAIPGGSDAVAHQEDARQLQQQQDRAGELMRAAPVGGTMSAANGPNAWDQYKALAQAQRDRAMAGQEVGPVMKWQGSSDGREATPINTSDPRYVAHQAWLKARDARPVSFADSKAMVVQNAWEKAAARRGRMGIDPGITPQQAAFQTAENPTWGQTAAAYPGALQSHPDVLNAVSGAARQKNADKAYADVFAATMRATDGDTVKSQEAARSARADIAGGQSEGATPIGATGPNGSTPAKAPAETDPRSIPEKLGQWAKDYWGVSIPLGIAGLAVAPRAGSALIKGAKWGWGPLLKAGEEVGKKVAGATTATGGAAGAAASAFEKAAAGVAERTSTSRALVPSSVSPAEAGKSRIIGSRVMPNPTVETKVAKEVGKAAAKKGILKKIGGGALKVIANPYVATGTAMNDIQDFNNSIDERLNADRLAKNPTSLGPWSTEAQQEEADLMAKGFETVPGFPGAIRPISRIGSRYYRPEWER